MHAYPLCQTIGDVSPKSQAIDVHWHPDSHILLQV